MPRFARRLVIISLVVCPRLASASPIVIGFDDLTDATVVNSQYPGLTLSNTVALAAGISLNDFEFPPHSGSNVASDSSGPIRIDFVQPVSYVGGYFTYGEAVTLRAFDASNSFVGSITSQFSNNEALSGAVGSSPNEFLQLAFSNISYVTLTGDPFGGSFTFDDFTYRSASTPSDVPEPGTLSLLLLGGIGLVRSRHLIGNPLPERDQCRRVRSS